MLNAVLWTAKAAPASQVTAPEALSSEAAPRPGVPRPNVVVILADDLGWGDVTCYNPESKITKPRIDALAAEGMRMTSAYTPASVCSPTRYGLLTGRYPWRTWHKDGVLYHYDPSLIRPGRMTLGTLCQQREYATAAIGKWHLGLDWQPRPGDPGDWMVGQPIRYADKKLTATRIDFTKPILVGPREVGFDRFFGTVHQGRDDHVVRDRLRIPDFVAEPSDHDDHFVEEAIDFIEDCRRQEPAKPFLLYMPLGSPHHAREVPPRLQGKSGDGVRGDRVLWVDESVGRILDVLATLAEIEGRWKPSLGTEGSGGHRGITPEWAPIQTGWERAGEITAGQLYDVENDPYERTNLFAGQPAVVARLRGKLDKIVADGRSRPLPTATEPLSR